MRGPQVACLPIGTGWGERAQREFADLVHSLPGEVELDQQSPVLQEVAILEAADRMRGRRPDLLLLAAMHGGSARALVLAARAVGRPTAIWCHNEKHSLASSSLAADALRQLEHPFCLLHGFDSEIVRELVAAIRAGCAVNRLRAARIGQLGPLHCNLIGTEVNPLVIHRRFGSWVVPLFLAGMKERMTDVEPERVSDFVRRLRGRCSVQAADESLEGAVRFHLVLADVVGRERLDAVAVDCWNEIMPELSVSPCLGFSEQDSDRPYVIACERDLILAVTLIAGEALCNRPGYVGDFYALEEASGERSGEAVLMHCAGCAGMHSAGEPMVIAEQPPPGPAGQHKRVIACRPVLEEGEATLVLLHGMDLDRLHMRKCQILTTDFSDQMQVRIRIEGNVRAFRRAASGNHYVVFPGDHRDSWNQWARWAGVHVEGET